MALLSKKRPTQKASPATTIPFNITPDTTIPLTLTKSRRKTLTIKVNPDQTITIKAPLGLSDTKLDSLIQSKTPWIQKQLTKLASRPKPQILQNGSIISYLGYPHQIQLKDTSISLTKSTYSSPTPYQNTDTMPQNPNTHNTILDHLKSLAKDILIDRVEHYRHIASRPIKRILVKTQKNRWGSCSSQGNINLNWQLIQCPLPVIDYVIIHELCHLTHMNHSKAFWDLVHQYCPSYKTHKQWLKTNEHQLKLTRMEDHS